MEDRYFEHPSINEHFHNAFSHDMDDNIFLIDNTKFVRINFGDGSVRVYEDQYCRNLRVVDQDFLYTMSIGTDQKPPGLYFYNYKNIIEQDEAKAYFMQSTIMGPAGLDYNFRNERLAIITSYHTMVIYPLLHRNTLSFIGMPSTDQILATKEGKEELTILTRQNQIVTFSKVTSKVVHSQALNKDVLNCDEYSPFVYMENPDPESDMSDYLRGWFKHCLIRSKEPVE